MIEHKNGEFEVLNPWADADPVPLNVLSKPAARPILTAVETQLKKRYPTCETVWYGSNLPWTRMQIESEYKAKFEEWVKGVDAVVGAVGD